MRAPKHLAKSVIVSMLALQARHILAKYNPKVIAVIGSVGKTGTKDAIYTALAPQLGSVRKSAKSLNSDIGVPLTIIGAKSAWSNPIAWLAILWRGLSLILFTHEYPKWLVLEVGMDNPGEMRGIAQWLVPDVVVITALPETPVHVANFNSVDEVIAEKLAIPRALRKGGVLVLNGDDAKVREVAQEFDCTKIFYSADDIQAEISYAVNAVPLGMHYNTSIDGEHHEVTLHGIVGEQWSYLVLAALCVCKALSLDTSDAARALSTYKASPGRMRILEGVRDSIVIDDSYNSSPIALKSALNALAELEVRGRKIAVLGDMRELGEHSSAEHTLAGAHAATVADILITIGQESEVLAEAALHAGMSKENIVKFGYYESAKAGEYVRDIVQKGDVVLVKGSQNKIRTERVVKAVMANPEKADNLLVRQEPQWQNKL